MSALHLLVSRFNWPHPSWKSRPAAEYRNWLVSRLALFERLTVRSVLNCYKRPDLWVILVNECELDLKISFSRILSGLPYRLIFYSGISIEESLRVVIAEMPLPMEVRTTRLDTDDLVASDFFARLNSVKVPLERAKAGVVVSFPGGANYNVANDTFYYSSYPDNPFLTLIEHVNSTDEFRSVYWRMHNELPSGMGSAMYLRSYHPMWASVIQDNNLANYGLSNSNVVQLGEQDFIKRKFGIAEPFFATRES